MGWRAFLHSDIPDVLHNVSFFKHYTPQLTHNCCPCHMNYAAFDVNSDSLALNKSKGVSEPGVITKVIPVDWGRKLISSTFFDPGWFVWYSCAKFPLGCHASAIAMKILIWCQMNVVQDRGSPVYISGSCGSNQFLLIQILSWRVLYWNFLTELKSEWKILLTKAKQVLQYTMLCIIQLLKDTTLTQNSRNRRTLQKINALKYMATCRTVDKGIFL